MIRVESVKIERFRGIRQGEITGLADVSLLVGRNNSGKTTIVEAVSRVLGGVTPTSSGGPLNRKPAALWHNVRKHFSSTPQEMWYRSDDSQPLVLHAVIGGTGLTLTIKPQHPTIPSGQPDSTQVEGQPKALKNRFADQVTVFRPADTADQEIEKRLWAALLANRADKRVVEAINDIFAAGVEQVSLPPDGRLMILFADHGLPLDVQGDGARAALRCLFVLAALQGSLLILEEPESHQHPGSLEKFALAVCKQARRQEVQLLITTHSIECVRAFLRAAGAAGSESAVFHLKLEDGVLDSRRLESTTVETLLETGVDVRCLDLYA